MYRAYEVSINIFETNLALNGYYADSPHFSSIFLLVPILGWKFWFQAAFVRVFLMLTRSICQPVSFLIAHKTCITLPLLTKLVCPGLKINMTLWIVNLYSCSFQYLSLPEGFNPITATKPASFIRIMLSEWLQFSSMDIVLLLNLTKCCLHVQPVSGYLS